MHSDLREALAQTAAHQLKGIEIEADNPQDDLMYDLEVVAFDPEVS